MAPLPVLMEELPHQIIPFNRKRMESCWVVYSQVECLNLKLLDDLVRFFPWFSVKLYLIVLFIGTISSSTPSLNNNESDKSPSPKLTPSKNFDSIQDQLKKQLHNPSDTRARGPPPPAPTRHVRILLSFK